MDEDRVKVIVVFMDGQIKEFYSSRSYDLTDGVFIWYGASVNNKSVDFYSVPAVNVREVFEYE